MSKTVRVSQDPVPTPGDSKLKTQNSKLNTSLTAIVGPEYVHTASSADAIDGVMPRWVVEPGSVEEASAVLRLAHGDDLAVAPRGAGTKMGLGNVPRRLDLILSTARMNRVLEHASGDLVARLEAGVRLEDAQAVFARAGQWLPLDPPEPSATIGGIIAANASGPHRFRYGTVRDLLIGITYILPDGTVAKAGGKVVKNVAGYDLCKLFTGSLGTLGLIAEAIVRLYPVPAASRTVVLRQRGSLNVAAAMRALVHSSLVPSAIVYMQELRERVLAMLIEGIEQGVEAQAALAVEILLGFAGDVSIEEDDAARGLWRRAGLREVPAGSQGAMGLRISGLPSEIDCILAEISAVVSGHAHDFKCFPANGIVHAWIAAEPSDLIVAVRRLRERLSDAHIAVTAGPAKVKSSIDVWGDPGDALPLMRRVKARFDPQGIMNPGRFVGGI